MTTEEAIGMPNSAYQDLEKRLDTYMRRVFGFHDGGFNTTNEYDPKEVEYFGILSLTDVRAPRRKLWYMYYATSDQLDETIDRIHRKYGQKNMYELFRKPVFSGAGMRARVKNHFTGLKWYVKGNVLEASPNSCYTDEKVVKTVADLYVAERRNYYNYLNERSALYKKEAINTRLPTNYKQCSGEFFSGWKSRQNASLSMALNKFKLEDKLEKYWRRLFYMQPLAEPTDLDLSELEYFGVFSVRAPLAPDRRLWCIYSCLQPDILKLRDQIRQKYGKKNVWEIYRKPTFSGVGFRSIVRKHFSHLKWKTDGSLLEAPAKSHYNDERIVKDVTDLYEKEHKRLFDYIMVQHDWFRRYNDQKPPPRFY